MPIDSSLRDSAKAELAHETRSENAILRANAIEGIQESVGAEGSDTIVAGLADRSPVVRFASCMAAGELRIKDARPALLDLVADKDKHVQIGARFALHRLGDKRLSHDFERYARDFDPHVRADAALALGLLGESSAQVVLEPMLNDSEPYVRLQVAEALWRLGNEDGLTNLAAGAVSGFADDQILCILGLAVTHDDRVYMQIRGRLTAEWPEVALAAARALGELGSDRGFGVASNFVGSRDPRVRVLAALAFGAIGRPDAQQLLTPLLKDAQPTVRLAAATAILQLKPAATQFAGG